MAWAEVFRQSSVYQAIFEEGQLAAKIDWLRRLGTKRLGPPPREVDKALKAIEDLSYLDYLFETLEEAVDWDDWFAMEVSFRHGPT